jgi:predicted TIM-barrel fold metal-dependent hydrolase
MSTGVLTTKPEVESRVAIRVVDTDVHPAIRKLEPAQMATYVEEPWRSRLTARANSNWVSVNSNYYDPPDYYNAAANRYDARPPSGGAACSDPDFAFEQLIVEAGVDVAILQPLGRHFVDPDEEHAHMQVANGALADIWLDQHNTYSRWYGSICVTPRDPVAGAREIERWAEHPHFVQVLMSPGARISFGDPVLDPIYAAASRHNLPVATHIFGLGPYEHTPIFPVGNPSHWHDFMSGWPLIFVSHVMSLVLEGTFERHPNLRFVFVEGDFTWIMPVLWRLDRHWERRKSDLPNLRRRPSDYIRDHIRFTTQPLDDPDDTKQYLRYLEWMESSRFLMFSTDYPHWTYDDPTWATTHFPKEARENIMFANALEWFPLPDTVPAIPGHERKLVI